MSIRLPKDATAPAFGDTIVVDGARFDLTGTTVKLQMRRYSSTTLKVDAAAVPDPDQVLNKGDVAYQWQPGDLDTEGIYLLWWHVQYGGNEFTTPEQQVEIAAHQPGEILVFGSIAQRARRLVPTLWKALAEFDPFGGEDGLQATIEAVKQRELTTVPSAENESALDPFVQQWLAKLTVVDLYPTAIDYYSNIRVSIDANNERATYPDRLKALSDLVDQLAREAAAERSRAQAILGQGASGGGGTSRPRVSTEGVPLVTPDPSRFPQPFDQSWVDRQRTAIEQ